MHPEYRQRLLNLVARLDQLATETGDVQIVLGKYDRAELADEALQLQAELRDTIEAKLDAQARP